MLQKTKRLFYGKFPYKIECRQQEASRIRYNGADNIIAWCEGKKRMHPWWDDDKTLDRAALADFARAAKPFLALPKEKIMIRVESSHFHFFCKNKSDYKKILRAMNPWVIQQTEPQDETKLQFLLDNGRKKVLCENLPHGSFRYRVYIKNTTPAKIAGNFYLWINKYPEKIKLPAQTANWLQTSKQIYNHPYFYILDEKMLSMALLYLGSYCHRIEEFILESSINS